MRTHRFLRAPVLAGLADAELARLDALDPAIIVDFRGTAEAREVPSQLPARLQARRVAVPIEPSATPRFRVLHEQHEGAAITHEDVMAVMVETYRDFIRVHASTYALFLRTIAEAGERPVLFHCTAGKDRTGVAAALILSGLGIGRADIMRDYLATAALWQPDARLRARLPAAAHPGVYGVYPAYLEAAFDELERLSGGAEAFVSDAMGGEEKRARWTAMHLENA